MIYNKMDDGRELFLRLDWIRACADCRRRNQDSACTHIEPRPQHFQPRGAQRRQRALMTPFGKVLALILFSPFPPLL